MRKIILFSLLAFIGFAACEELEDTYDDYTGDGPVLYLTKCTDVTVTSGWEKLTISWKNNLDPNRSGVWVQCQSNDYLLDTVVAATDTSCVIRNLTDASYNVKVAAISEAGDTSLTALGSGRPYSPDHEAVTGYTRGITKFIFVKENLALFTAAKSEDMVRFTLDYTDMEANPQEYVLTDNMNEYGEGFLFLKDVNPNQPVTLHRQGMLEECPDTITFPEIALEPGTVTMAADFKSRLIERYGEDFSLEVDELELDYDLSSIEDILYFPNLKRLVLGKNRYYALESEYGVEESVLTGGMESENRSMSAFETLHEINPDFEIVNYGTHYGIFPYYYDYVKQEDYPLVPEDLLLLDTTGFEITNSVEGSTPTFEKSMLLDDNPQTAWEPLVDVEQRTYELTIDLGGNKTVKGLKITQALVTGNAQYYLPESISVSVSTDKVEWTNPCHSASNTLGNVVGETRLLDFATAQTVRFIRLTLKDRYYGSSAGCILGDVIPY